jgi:hypothetical protein
MNFFGREEGLLLQKQKDFLEFRRVFGSHAGYLSSIIL